MRGEKSCPHELHLEPAEEVSERGWTKFKKQTGRVFVTITAYQQKLKRHKEITQAIAEFVEKDLMHINALTMATC